MVHVMLDLTIYIYIYMCLLCSVFSVSLELVVGFILSYDVSSRPLLHVRYDFLIILCSINMSPSCLLKGPCIVLWVCLFAYSVVFTFLVLCCDVPYDFLIKRIFGSSVPQMFVGEFISYLCYLCLLAYTGIQHVSFIWVTWRVFYKRQELFTLREHLGSPPCLVESMLPVYLVICVVILFFFFSNVYYKLNN